jgi:hypothetical protein
MWASQRQSFFQVQAIMKLLKHKTKNCWPKKPALSWRVLRAIMLPELSGKVKHCGGGSRCKQARHVSATAKPLSVFDGGSRSK